MPTNNFKLLETRLNADASADIWFYGTITDERERESDITALDVVSTINKLQDAQTLTVHINSSGGDVFEGQAIFNTLRECGKTINVIGEGIVASIASFIAMAGDHFAMTENSTLMVHNPLVLMLGMFNKHDMAKLSGELDTIRDTIISAYTNKTGMSAAQIVALLDGPDGQGTYLTPQEALKYGFCDSIIPAKTKMVAQLQPAIFKCKGHTLRLDFNKNAQTLAPAVSQISKGGTQMAKQNRPKMQEIGITCPNCQGRLVFDTSSLIVSPDPTETATVATPQEKSTATFKNEIFAIACPLCGGEFEYDSAPAGETTPMTPPAASEPIPQANNKPRVTAAKQKPKAVTTASFRMETAPVPITCTECQTEFTIDVDATIQEAIVTCPNCAAELTVDTSNVGGAAPVTPDAPAAAAAPESDVIVAFRNGMQGERQRLTVLDERAKAFPQFANAIEQFKKNGTSIECANNWIFKALAANPQQSNPAYMAAARRDAAPLNKVGIPAKVNDKAAQVTVDFNSLAARRGTLRNE